MPKIIQSLPLFMSTIDPKKIENLKNLRKPQVNSSCIGCCACAAISGDVFEMDMDTGLSTVKNLDSYEWKSVDDAIAACPVRAISWQK